MPNDSIKEKYWAQGAEISTLGFPIGESGNINAAVTGKAGKVQGFEGGAIYTSELGTFIVLNGSIKDRYWAQLAENGSLGLPISDAYAYLGGTRQDFEGGFLTTGISLGLSLNPASVNGGASATGTVTLPAAAPAGGVVIALSSDNAKAVVPASVAVAAGQTSQTFTVTTAAVTGTQSVTISAELAGSSRTAMLNLTSLSLTPPNDLRATVGNRVITLNWTDVATGETGYKVERFNAGTGKWIEILRGENANQSSYIDNDVVFNSIYSYRVRAYKSGVGNGDVSNVATVTMIDTTLATPSGLTATLTTNRQGVALSWTDNASGESGTKVERLESGATRWVEIARGTTPDQTSYTDNSVALNTTYSYRVRPYKSGVANGEASNIASITLPAMELSAPLNLTAVGGYRQIVVSWTNTALGASGTKVERFNAANGRWVEIARGTSPTQTSYTDTGLLFGTTYTYRLRAYKSGVATGAVSDSVSATPLSNDMAPPTELSATGDYGQIMLRWSDNATQESGYKVERFNGGQWIEVLRGTAPNQTSYADTNVTEGTAYTYRVRAYQASGADSDASNEASATALNSALAPVIDLSASAVSGRVALSWTDRASAESGYKVERMTGNSGRWIQLARGNAPDQNSYVDADVTAGTNYSYRVRPYQNGVGNGEASNVVSITVNPPSGSAIQAKGTKAEADSVEIENGDSEAESSRRANVPSQTSGGGS